MPITNSKLKAVIDNDMCIACGACIPACPRNQLVPTFSAYRGSNEVGFVAAADCDGCNAPCAAVCPSIKIDFAEISGQRVSAPTRDGWVQSTHLGYSPTFRNDGKSSSGGVLRALAYMALEDDIPVLTLVKEAGDSVEYRPGVLESLRDLDRMPGSIYHSTSFAGAIEQVRDLDRPCLMIALPCQLAGILNYVTYAEPDLRSKIKYSCGIICGWQYSYHAHWYFLHQKGLNVTLSDIGYRGEDKVGFLKFRAGDQVFSYERKDFRNKASALEYQAAYSTDLNRLRCRVCQDHTNILADIIAGDAWLSRKRSEKTSVICLRTENGQALFEQLIARGYLEEEDGTYADVIESQSENLVYGKTARKLSRWLQGRGLPITEYRFAQDNDVVRLSLLDRLAFRLEWLRRHLVRRRYYIAFKFMYLAKRFTRTALNLYRSCVRILKDK